MSFFPNNLTCKIYSVMQSKYIHNGKHIELIFSKKIANIYSKDITNMFMRWMQYCNQNCEHFANAYSENITNTYSTRKTNMFMRWMQYCANQSECSRLICPQLLHTTHIGHRIVHTLTAPSRHNFKYIH